MLCFHSELPHSRPHFQGDSSNALLFHHTGHRPWICREEDEGGFKRRSSRAQCRRNPWQQVGQTGADSSGDPAVISGAERWGRGEGRKEGAGLALRGEARGGRCAHPARAISSLCARRPRRAAGTHTGSRGELPASEECALQGGDGPQTSKCMNTLTLDRGSPKGDHREGEGMRSEAVGWGGERRGGHGSDLRSDS